MRKKELIKQIEEYVQQLNNANNLIKKLYSRIDELETEIEISESEKQNVSSDEITVSLQDDVDEDCEFVEISVEEALKLMSELPDGPDDFEDDFDTEDHSSTLYYNLQDYKLNDTAEYAAEIIGKIIVNATSTCNKIKESEKINQKELITLVFGKTELLKSEILDIVSDKDFDDSVKSALDLKLNEAEDYFCGILKQ